MAEEKSPAFQFYYKEWLTGTKGLTRVERDIYLTLLIFQFDTKNQLPADVKELYRIADIKTKSEKDSLAYVVEKKFSKSECGNFLVNKKMTKVISQLDAYKQKQAENGRNGGRPKKAVGYFGLSETKPKKSSTTASTTVLENTERNTATLAHEEVVKETLNNEIFIEQAAMLLKTTKEIFTEHCCSSLAQMAITGKSSKYPLGTVKNIIIQNFKVDKETERRGFKQPAGDGVYKSKAI